MDDLQIDFITNSSITSVSKYAVSPQKPSALELQQTKETLGQAMGCTNKMLPTSPSTLSAHELQKLEGLLEELTGSPSNLSPISPSKPGVGISTEYDYLKGSDHSRTSEDPSLYDQGFLFSNELPAPIKECNERLDLSGFNDEGKKLLSNVANVTKSMATPKNNFNIRYYCRNN